MASALRYPLAHADTWRVTHARSSHRKRGRLPVWVMAPLTVVSVLAIGQRIVFMFGCLAVGSALGAWDSLVKGDVRNLGISLAVLVVSCADLAWAMWSICVTETTNERL
jgi:hypothetical protein